LNEKHKQNIVQFVTLTSPILGKVTEKALQLVENRITKEVKPNY